MKTVFTSSRSLTVRSMPNFVASLKTRAMNFLLINWFKVLVVCLMVTASLVVKYGSLIQDADVDKPFDIAHQILLPLNLFAMERPMFRDVWIATTSFLLDLSFFVVLANWLTNGYSMRTPISITIFYAIRALLQQVFILPFPENIYWEDPGFPCLLNIYGRQSDFFYSGHIGFCLMWVLENYHLKATKSYFFCIFSTIFVGFTLLTFQVHYTIDIFTGLIMSHYWFYTVGRIVSFFDCFLLNENVRRLNPREKRGSESASAPTSLRE